MYRVSTSTNIGVHLPSIIFDGICHFHRICLYVEIVNLIIDFLTFTKPLDPHSCTELFNKSKVGFYIAALFVIFTYEIGAGKKKFNGKKILLIQSPQIVLAGSS